MHTAGELRDARDLRAGRDAGTVCSGLRCDSDVEPWRGDLRGYARTCLHEDGNRGALCADRPGHALAGPPAAVERRRNREASDGAHEIFWSENRFLHALAAVAAESQLARSADASARLPTLRLRCRPGRMRPGLCKPLYSPPMRNLMPALKL